MNLRKDHYHTDPTDRTLRTVRAAREIKILAAQHTYSRSTTVIEPTTSETESASVDAASRRVRRITCTECDTTFSNGYLGSRNDEERSEMRYVVRIAEFSESSKL